MGTVNSGFFTSTTDQWPTPQAFFDALDAEFGFTLDPCANVDNAKCARFFTEADDGLAQSWDGVVFMNPPYGRSIGRWVAKAHLESQRGATVVCLIPARTDTAYWHDHVMKAAEIRLIRGRLHFDNQRHRDDRASGKASAHNAPFPSAVVVFRPEHATVGPSLHAMDRAAPEPEPTGPPARPMPDAPGPWVLSDAGHWGRPCPLCGVGMGITGIRRGICDTPSCDNYMQEITLPDPAAPEPDNKP